jgi:hypothetical protein
MIRLFNPEWVTSINIMGTWMRIKRGTYEEFEANKVAFVKFQILDWNNEYAIVSDLSIVGWTYLMPTLKLEETKDEVKQP